MTVIRAAITQVEWTGDEESMVARHEALARRAAEAGAQIICFQELFHGPYFGIVQDAKYYEYAQAVPGPLTERFSVLAKDLGVVLILPVYEEEMPGVYYNTAAVIDSDGKYLGKYRKNHIPNVDRFWEKFYFKPGNLGYPIFDTAVGKVGVYICYDRHFPEAGANSASPEPKSSSTFGHQTRFVQPPMGTRTARCSRQQSVLRGRQQPDRYRERRIRR